ncbi:DUF1003 domain-containing protein [Phenylobacterium sp. J367]|uniref:DUF1003 domain-containing protein n=1 Tax=Phenylobacterium sp. J367 TaxID=2898435 RepID=UPI002150DA6C|nr:DUF1003 domain-containing protein [Phenylobacterium sp. J367]MCR5877068.1 DUF1003 domain-containing protein [Phenylobacterium sp. J367]
MASDKRQQLSQDLLGASYETLSDIQRSVIDLIATEAPTGVDQRLLLDDRRPSERVADKVAEVGGSWAFIIGFATALLLWMGWNVATKGFGLDFDPYPFIFLNLLLSTLAAVQAPIIMMSQNRAAARDREAAEHDYLVNLRAELEIMHLHDKIDRLRQREILQMIKRQNETLRILRAEISEAFRPAPPGGAPAAAGRKRAGKRGASAPDR